ncbi:LOW QUALITY PROTEIN: SPEG neighbor protein-like [Lycodopsis pacificus]
MSKAKAAPPPGCTLNINDPQVQEAAIRNNPTSAGIIVSSQYASSKGIVGHPPPLTCLFLFVRYFARASFDPVLAGKKACSDSRIPVSAFPDPFIIWCKDGKQLKDGPKYRYVFEDPYFVALVVRDGMQADLGKYMVSIKNPFGQTCGSACILFPVSAKVAKGPDNMKAKRGTTVVLKAEIRGPPPDVAWLKDGDDIDEDDRVFFDIGDTDTILTIKNAKLSDAGRYEVFAENSLGTDQSFACVDIL